MEKEPWATCEFERNGYADQSPPGSYTNEKKCETMMKKFMPLLGKDKKAIPPVTNFDFEVLGVARHKEQPRYMCADDGLIGLGQLTDHCLKTHGWWEKDYDTVCNLGRGKLLLEVSSTHGYAFD